MDACFNIPFIIIFKLEMALRVAAIALLFIIATPYATLLSISTTSTATISNYYQDFASCSCDLTPSLCDNFCCCDSQCVC